MKRQTFLLFALPATLCISLMAICLSIQGHDARAIDGNGPDPLILLQLAVAWILGIGLAATTFHGIRATGPKPGRMRVVAYHVALWIAVGGTFAVPRIGTALSTSRLQQTPEWKAPGYVADGSMDDIERIYTQARNHAKDPIELDDAMTSAALAAYRIDVLTYLKSQGVRVAEPGMEARWFQAILDVLRASGTKTPQATLGMVTWLVDEGAAQGFSLKGESGLSDVELYGTAYRDIDDPATRELLQLLVAHGADVVGCGDATLAHCPVVYLSGKGNTPAIRYLLAHGANPNAVDPVDGETALSEAIRGGHPETVEALLAAGARPRLEDYHNDLVNACNPGIEKQEAVVQGLHEANLHMSSEDLARYVPTIEGNDRLACVKRFMERARR